MENMRIGKFAILFVLSVCQTAGATVNEHLDFQYYTAQADPNRSLRNILNDASPIRENGALMHGHTSWHVRWRFRWHESPGGRCRMTEVNTDLTAEIKLPRIVNATAKQEDQFNRYVAALRVHEMGHYEHGRQAAMDIDRAILSLPEMGSCQALGAAANDVGYSILRQHADQDVQYDAATSHGRTQGAVLSN